MENIREEYREPSTNADLIQAARSKPGAHIYDIDWSYPDDQPTPPEAIRGSWAIDSDGRISGRYAVNPRYRPIVHSTRTLKSYMHAGAKHTRDQWIVEIDPRGESLFPNIPQDMIRGWWYVDKDGHISDQFRQNSLWSDNGNDDLS